MKIGLLAIIFTLISALANAQFVSITAQCQNDVCITGQEVIWHIMVSNSGTKIIEYTDFELLEAINNTVIAEEHREYFPLRDYRGDLLVVEQGKKKRINITSTVPKPNSPDGLIFYPCASNTVEDIHVFVRHNDYKIRQCFNVNFTVPVVGCLQDVDCKNNQVCVENACMPLKCTDCQLVENHACINLECCSSEACAFNAICANNTCQPLQCSYNEKIQDKACVPLNCNFDEYILNNSCTQLECTNAEYVFNQTCKQLLCPLSQYIFNHTCKSCRTDEFIENGQCAPLRCNLNEAYNNHTCVPLQCAFYQDIANHGCKNNNLVIGKLATEGFVILLIVGLFALDIRKIVKKRIQKQLHQIVSNHEASIHQKQE